jgi:hypothetical protein
MNGGRSSSLAWWSAATIFVSAFLLFQVQPIISKKILPWFGGSPAVWTTALLFFQVGLLAGYAYAHLLIRYVPLARQPLVHLFLLLAALLTLPITPSSGWKPPDGSEPTQRILLLLLCEVGPAYFLLSSTGPLVQAWFAQAYPGHSPYRLYALSNIGSLLALLSYPFWFEIVLPVDTQGTLWSFGFVLFAGLIAIMGLGVWRLAADERARVDAVNALPESVRPAFDAPKDDQLSPPPWLCLGWILLAALGTTALMAITNQVCQDISVDPFMWVVPLSLYLVSLIICFDNEWWYIRKLWGPLAIFGILALTAVNNGESVRLFLDKYSEPAAFKDPDPTNAEAMAGDGVLAKSSRAVGRIIVPPVGTVALTVWDVIVPTTLTTWYDDNLVAQGIAYVAVLFLICMVCHGELARSKPLPKYLTMYFLMVSAGGALGGLFVAVICPFVFQTYFELTIVIVAGLVVGWLALANDGRESWLKDRSILQWAAAFLVVGTTLLVAKGNYEVIDPDTILSRNFYGVLSVKKLDQDDPSNSGRALYHGRILHGFQFRTPIQVGNTVLFQPPGASEPQTFEATTIDKNDNVTLRGADGTECERRLADWSLELANEQQHAREMEPNTYYVSASGVGMAAEHYPRRTGEGLRVAVIGLGTGTMASHGKEGDFYRFYDIDPKVVAISDKYFTYRQKTPAKNEVVLGDARIRMEREEPQNYDLVVLDAFSGDAIPSHLLTAEAVEQYLRHLRTTDGKPTGIIAVHISNRYLDLEPVVAAIARRFKITAKGFHVAEGDNGGGNGDTGSDWILLTENDEFWKNPTVLGAAAPLAVKPEKELLWTDQRSSLWPILNRE